MARVRSTIRAAVAPATPAATPLPRAQSRGVAAISQPADDASSSSSSSDSDGDGDAAANPAASITDEEISDVLDETELQLIEAMEDTQIVDAKSNGRAPLPTTSLKPSPPRNGLCWVGLGDISSNSRATYTDSLKERFAASQRRTGTAVKGSTGERDSDSSSSSSSNSSDSSGSDPDQCISDRAAIAAPVAVNTHQPLLGSSAPSPPPPAQSSSFGPPAMARATSPTPVAANIGSASARSGLFETRGDGSGADLARPASVPLDSVEFVAPGVTKKTAMSLLCRVLDIDGPIIQQKMVEFLLIDGVIASLIGFITHCQGSIYSPSSTVQTAPCSPSLCHEAGASGSRSSPDSGCCNLPAAAAGAGH
ncbi:hypothetical protein GGF44_005819, partial [Coemansia sp. RSA 1694]